MTDEEAERILNPKTTLEAYAESEYYGGFGGAEKWKTDVDEACVVAADALRERIERNNGWIPVEDRLPEKLEPVNIVWVNRDPAPYYASIKDKPFVATGYYYSKKWWWFSRYCEDYLGEYGQSDADLVDDGIEITHWMPLPQPPKEDKP